MSAKIGWYIHFRANNYLKFGTNYYGQSSNFGGLSSIIQQQQMTLSQTAISSQALGGIDPKVKKKFLDTLKIFMKQDELDPGQVDPDYALVWQTLLPFFEKEFGETAQMINKSLGNISSIVPVVNDLKKIKEGKSDINLKTLADRAIAITNAYTDGKYKLFDRSGNLVKTVPYSQVAQNKLGIEVKKIEAAMDSLYNEVVSRCSSEQLADTAVANRLKKAQFKLSDPRVQSILTSINTLLSVGRGAANNYKGTLFEWMVVASMYVASGLTGDALAQTLKQALEGAGKEGAQLFNLPAFATGKIETKVEFNKNDFFVGMGSTGSANMQKILGTHYIQQGDLFIANNATQDKVDTVIKLGPEGQTYNLSLKNANLSSPFTPSNIDLVSNASLLSLLSSIENHELVNHYLNQRARAMMRTVTTGKGKRKTSSEIKARNQYNTELAARLTMHGGIYAETQKVIALSLFEKALRGYKKNAAKADLLLINDNLTGTVQLFSMGDMLQQFMAMDIENLYKYLIIRPELSKLEFPMEWDNNSALDRITTLLQTVHSNKITIEVHPYFFGKNLGSYSGETI